jgi:hypothetical protein
MSHYALNKPEEIMFKNLRLFIPLLVLLAVSLACGNSDPNAPTSTPAPTATPKLQISLQVVNETQKSICYLFVVTAGKEFNKEYLDGKEIAPGESYTIDGFDAGKYNVRAHYCDKNMVNALYDVPMDQELMTWTIKEATLIVANTSAQEICEMYLSPSSAPESEWGPNQLGSEKLHPDQQVTFYIAKGKWDVRAVPCDATVDPIKEIGLNVEDSLTWTISPNQ